MSTNQSNSGRSKLAKAAGLVGKLGLTAICPPLGALTFGWKFKDRLLGRYFLPFMGVVLTGVASTAIEIGFRKPIYHDDKIYVSNGAISSHSPIRYAAEALSSPLAFYLDTTKATIVSELVQPETQNTDISRTFVEGDDAIRFDPSNKMYVLNFPENRIIRLGEERYSPKELSKLKLARGELLTKQRELEESGDIQRARGNLVALTTANRDYSSYSEKYDEANRKAKEAFQRAVGRMNQELSSIRDNSQKEGVGKQ